MSAKALAIIVLVCTSLYRLNYYFVDMIVKFLKEKVEKKVVTAEPPT